MFLYDGHLGGVSIRRNGAEILLFESDTGCKTVEVNVGNIPSYKNALRINPLVTSSAKNHSHSI